jgi:hypothetical protein
MNATQPPDVAGKIVIQDFGEGIGGSMNKNPSFYQLIAEQLARWLLEFAHPSHPTPKTHKSVEIKHIFDEAAHITHEHSSQDDKPISIKHIAPGELQFSSKPVQVFLQEGKDPSFKILEPPKSWAIIIGLCTIHVVALFVLALTILVGF